MNGRPGDETRYTSMAISEVRSLQASMSEQAEEGFAEAEIAEMKVVIRLTVEFAYYLRDPAWQADPEEVEYMGDSILAGVESFQRLVGAYNGLVKTVESDLTLPELSPNGLSREFASRFRRFTTAPDFATQCRLLLDLFKIQIIYAGLMYG